MGLSTRVSTSEEKRIAADERTTETKIVLTIERIALILLSSLKSETAYPCNSPYY